MESSLYYDGPVCLASYRDLVGIIHSTEIMVYVLKE